MRAIVIPSYGPPEVLTLSEVPTPKPGPGELLVRVGAAGLNRADILQRLGHYPPPPGASDIPGLECAGVVEEIGERVTSFAPGDRVCGLLPGGGYAEFATLHERMAIPVPDTLMLEEAGGLPEVWITAYDALFHRAGARPGDTVLIHAGASGVGTAAAALCLMSGMRPISTTRSPQKVEALKALGTEALVVEEGKFAEQVRSLTSGKGCNVVLDLVGASYFNENLDALGKGGRIVIIGLLGGAESQLPLGKILQKHVQVIGTTLRARPVEEKMVLTQTFIERTMPRFADGSLKPVVDRVIDWEQAAEAHRAMQDGEQVGKIILSVR